MWPEGHHGEGLLPAVRAPHIAQAQRNATVFVWAPPPLALALPATLACPAIERELRFRRRKQRGHPLAVKLNLEFILRTRAAALVVLG